MAAVNNIVFRNYQDADVYRKHLSVEEKAKLYDLICNIIPFEEEAYHDVWKKLGDNWTDKHSKMIHSNRIHAFYQLEAILRSAIKPTLDEIHKHGENGDITATTYRNVDLDLTLDKFCAFLRDTFNMEFIWGRNVLAEEGNEVEFFIKSKDNPDIIFLEYGEEFTPYYDDWWNLLNDYIPNRCLNGDTICLYRKGDGISSMEMKNRLCGVKNAKELFNKLVEFGY